MTIERAIQELASAIRVAADESGRPTFLRSSELEALYGAPSPSQAGVIGVHHLAELHDALGGPLGWGDLAYRARRPRGFEV